MSGWEGYIYQIQHKYRPDKEQYFTVNICQHAAIYGEDGTAWAVSSDWPGLTEYQHPLEQEDGTTRNVMVNEFKCALAVAGGNRQPTEAGVRMGNLKYMMTTYDQEANLAQLSCSQGGASIAKIGKGIVIGIWNKEE